MTAPTFNIEHVQKLNQKLGFGACATVYLGFDELSGGFVAIKEIPYSDITITPGYTSMEPTQGSHWLAQATTASQILREIRVMQSCEHPCLVSYYGVRRSKVGVQLLMEYVGGGSLKRLLSLRKRLPESVVRLYTRDILHGLVYLHEVAHVCHRDIKPANILLTPEGRCKMVDFGVAKAFFNERGTEANGSARHGFMKTVVGTPWYMAPEVIMGGDEDEDSCGNIFESYDPLRRVSYRDDTRGRLRRQCGVGSAGYTTSSDIWSMGVTVYELICGKKPFANKVRNPTAALFSVLHGAKCPPQLPDSSAASPQLKSFLNLCFVYDKDLRPSAKELLSHPWITSMGSMGVENKHTSSAVTHHTPAVERIKDAVNLPFLVWPGWTLRKDHHSESNLSQKGGTVD